MKQGFPHLLLALCLALLAGCSPSSSVTGSAQLAVSVPQALSASVSRVSVTVSAPEFSSASVDLVSSSGAWGGTFSNIPAGANRSFLAQAFDSSGTLLFEGSASGVSISNNQTSLVAITLQQANAPPPFLNEAPLIDSLVAPSTALSVGSTLALAATAHDPNPGDTLSYAWSSTAGSFSSATAASTSWTAPASTGIQTLTFTVTDSRGLSSSLFLAVNVLANGEQGNAQLSISFNTSPQVAALTATVSQLAVGQTTSVSASASDVDGDSLTYSWSASCAGSWADASSHSARFTPSALPAGTCNNCDLTLSVSDGRGGQTTGTLSLCVSGPPAPQHFKPFILYASGSSLTASPGQVLTYEVVASDPEGSALSFSWSATAGSPGTPANSDSSSRITWTAPACVSAGTTPAITATVTNAFDLTSTQSFSVTGLPVCVPSSWASTGPMASPRSDHTATLLPDGKVLVAGGSDLATAEVYDPASGTWSSTGPMHSRHSNHTATLLPNGKVLVAGGWGSANSSSTAEVYDPASGTWSETGLLTVPRSYHTATLLPDGKVLISGGMSSDSGATLTAAEVWDPAAGIGTWRAIGPMATPRFFHTATLLPDGKVFVVGGFVDGGGTAAAVVDVYDPALGTWSTAGSLATPRFFHTATLLPNGKVLIMGGANSGVGPLAAVDVYDPAAGTWSAAGAMPSPHFRHTATLLPNGRVLVAGGSGSSDSKAAGEYDPATGMWSTAGSMASPRSYHTATLLPNGKVLVVGGSDSKTAELYTPGTP